MENQLTFVKTLSIAKFKSEHMIDKIDIRQNPTTQAMSFAFVGGNGTVAKSYDKAKEKAISLVRDSEGVEFLILHNTVTTNIVDSL